MPLDYVPFGDCYTISLEYGAGHDAIDPFDVEAGRQWEADTSHDDRYLHPVIRRRVNHRGGRTLRLPEDICNDWTDDKLYRAAAAFIEERRCGDGANPGRGLVNVRDFEAAARARRPVHYDYFASGDEITVAANESAFRRRLVPRICAAADGRAWRRRCWDSGVVPVLIAPTAFHAPRLCRGEVATAAQRRPPTSR